MSTYKVASSDLTSIADAIRTKGGTSYALSFPSEFATAIAVIPTGIVPTGTINITQNEATVDVTQYAYANVSIPDVPTLITKSITANGTYSASGDNADGYSSVTVAVPVKLITGTFTGSTAGAPMDVSIPYTGNGYPVWLLIYPVNGTNKSGDAFASLVQQYAEGVFLMVKNNFSTAPTYDDTTAEANKAAVMAYYKSSSSDPTSITAGQTLAKPIYRNNNAMEAYADCVRLKNNTTMSVYIANTSYGFANGIEYAYAVMYSMA